MTDQDTPLTILALAVGNSRTRVGLLTGPDLHKPHSIPNDDPQAIVSALVDLRPADGFVSVVLASVNEPVAHAIERAIAASDLADLPQHRIGRDLPIPISATVDDPAAVGHDRLLNALGAHATTKQACVIIDTGTAVTVDFVDGVGSFHGGAIMPGVQMMLDALHERAVSLPGVRFTPPDDEPFGTDTRSAMLLGVAQAVRGGAHSLIDRYAQHYDAYPQIIATGGNAAELFHSDDLVEHIVPDLQLIGIRIVCERLIDEERQADDHDTQP